MNAVNFQAEEFENLLDKHYTSLLGFTAWIIKDNNVAEQVVVSLFVKIWQLYESQFLRFEDIRGYLFSAGYHESQRILSSGQTQTAPTPIIRGLLKQLSSTQLQIMKLFYFQKLTPAQIAAKLNIPEHQVKADKQSAENLLALVVHKA